MKLFRLALPIMLLGSALIVICGLDACNGCNGGGSAVITFHQVGSCNGWDDGSGGHFRAGPNAAYVVFKVHRIDNTQGNVDFNFDPAKMWVSIASRPHMDPSLSLARFIGVLSLVPTTVPKGSSTGLDGYSVTIVQTANPNGAIEANQTTYMLGYDTGAADPSILFSTDQTWTPLPNPTLDCTAITFK